MQTIFQILDNLILLSFVGVGFFVVEWNRAVLGKTLTSALTGLAFGLIAFLVTVTPVTLVDGATVDARAGPVILSSIMGGPISGLIAAFLGGLARGFVGGQFVFSGMVVYFVYALLGLTIRYFDFVTPNELWRLRAIIVMVLLSFFGATAMFFLIQPIDRAVQWLLNDLPFIFVANALSVLFTSLVIGIAIHYLKKTTEVIELNETLNIAKRAGKFGIWDFNIGTGTLKWDERSMELHGIDDKSFQGTYKDWSRNVRPEDLKAAQDKFDAALNQGMDFDTEYRVVLPDGSQRTIKGSAIVLTDASGLARRIIGTNLDLTELRTTQSKLDEARSIAAQAQKFDMIGQLTGGVAHDFNNLLAIILGNQELLKDVMERHPLNLIEARTLIEASIHATQRGAELTQNMLAYARKARLTPVQTDLNQVVRETENWLRRTIESRIEIETILQAGLWPTMVDRASLQSSLINLLVNARDATIGSGRVTVETSNIRIEAEYVLERGEDIAPGRYVMLAVTDNGHGIDSEAIEQVFDPFYTTKPVGSGTGLGLSMVQGFAKQSGGTIRVYSEVGVGTSFKLYFPAVQGTTDDVPAGDIGPGRPKASNQAGKRILLVEDQPEVLEILEKILLNEGYYVVTAKTGDDALKVFENDGEFDLIATDIVMPGMLQGPQLARRIRMLVPGARFIFLSGYASEATVHGNGLRPEDTRLMKPVSRHVLLEAVSDALSDEEE